MFSEKNNAVKLQNEQTSAQRFPLMCNNHSFGAIYEVDTDGRLWNTLSGEEDPWQREVPADMTKNSKDRTATAGKRKFSRLTSDNGTIVTVGRAEAIACSVPQIAAKRQPGTVLVFLDGDESNETAANLTWGTKPVRTATTKPRTNKPGSRKNQLLTDDDVREILSSFDPNDHEKNTSAFAKRFGVAMATINNVVVFKTFPDISRAEFAGNPHIKQQNYFETYQPSPGTQLYDRYKRLGRPVKAVEMENQEQSQAETGSGGV